ncbi:hypothetical protein PV328_012007 [Microctonus aethiopoides]|uniref:Uncharacterized protein n=1 Tax=Microctonus aethiopoides TaxID=144406 RepID=A0AA39KQ02_9HYME|nr:hypothetical protein PV328_012007 [Microctonus aethiopoides]
MAMILIDEKAENIHRVTRMLFESPFKWDELPKHYKTMNLWVMRNYHGILWDAGDIPYNKLNDVLDIILKDVAYIYVKGSEKKQWLSDIIGGKSNLIYHCAFENVKQFKCWMQKKSQMQNPSIGRSLELYYQLEERIEDMRPQDIAYFTKEFILKFASTKIDKIWNKLPENLQKDEDIIAHRRCHKHYNPIAIDYDEFEGIIPLMKDCSICKEGK